MLGICHEFSDLLSYLCLSMLLLQVVYDDVYMLDDEMKWKNLPPMPKPDSHIEFAWAMVNNSIVLVGGTTEKHPNTKRMVLVGEVFQFNLNNMVFSFNSLFILIVYTPRLIGCCQIGFSLYLDSFPLNKVC